jgi:glycosyltransferase involved in cell wall biosynthesis
MTTPQNEAHERVDVGPPIDGSTGDQYLHPFQTETVAAVVVGGGSVALAGAEMGRPTEPTLAELEARLEDLERKYPPADRSKEVFALGRNPDNYFEIDIKSNVRPEMYRPFTPKAMWDLMKREVATIRGKTVIFGNSTWEGGGVAMQEPPTVQFLRAEGVDAHWLTSKPDDAAFKVTKKMHNLQQDVLGPGERYTDDDKDVHREYGRKFVAEASERVPYFAEADYIWWEDPQLVGGLEDARAINPRAKHIFRNHIQTDRDKMAREGSPQNDIYKYLHDDCGVGGVDTYVAHPVPQFWPEGTKVVPMPPGGDPFEDLNMPLTPEERDEQFEWMNGQIEKQNVAMQIEYVKRYDEELGAGNWPREWAHVDDQPPIDRSRPLLSDWARFDWAKGKHHVLDLHRRVTDRLKEWGVPEDKWPQTIDAGNGATDDTDRSIVRAEMMRLRREEYAGYQDKITVIAFDHNYRAPNALLTESFWTEIMSTEEGFEHRRAESQRKGTPSASTNAGGLTLQGKDGEGGLVADLADIDNELDRLANEIAMDIVDPERYEARRRATLKWAGEFCNLEYGTVANVIRVARILNGKANEVWQIRDIIAAEEQKVQWLGALAV